MNDPNETNLVFSMKNLSLSGESHDTSQTREDSFGTLEDTSNLTEAALIKYNECNTLIDSYLSVSQWLIDIPLSSEFLTASWPYGIARSQPHKCYNPQTQSQNGVTFENDLKLIDNEMKEIGSGILLCCLKVEISVGVVKLLPIYEV